jgi:hypothetical protein
MTIGPRPRANTGSWRSIKPQKSKFRYTKAKEPAPLTPRERLKLRKETAAREAEDAATHATETPPLADGAKTMGADDAVVPPEALGNASAALDVSASVDRVIAKAERGIQTPSLRRNLREALRDEVEKSVARLEQELASDASWQAMSAAERDSAMALARTKLAEQAHQAALAELDARIAARHGDVQQVGHAAGNEGVSQKAVERATRGADAELRALDRARAAAEGVEAEELTKAKPRKKPRTRKTTTRAGVERSNRHDWRAIRDSWDAAGYGDALGRTARGSPAAPRRSWTTRGSSTSPATPRFWANRSRSITSRAFR